MRRAIQSALGMLACCAVVGGMVLAADPPATTRAEVRTGDKAMHHCYRSSKLVGMSVRNTQGEKIGSVDDLVIDMNTGNISYVALGFGGVLGFGEKLFAVPFNQFKFERTDNDHYFVLNVDKDRLKEMPGFDKNHWPDLADPNWAQHIDKYYSKTKTQATTPQTTTGDRDR